MLTRRELIRRALGLPLVAGLVAAVGRRPKRSCGFPSFVATDVRWHEGTILRGDVVCMKNYQGAVVIRRDHAGTVAKTIPAGDMAELDFRKVCAWYDIEPHAARKSILETFPHL